MIYFNSARYTISAKYIPFLQSIYYFHNISTKYKSFRKGILHFGKIHFCLHSIFSSAKQMLFLLKRAMYMAESDICYDQSFIVESIHITKQWWFTDLTHWGWDKMAGIFHKYFQIDFLEWKIWKKKIHWSLFSGVRLTIVLHCFRWWLGTEWATSHHLNLWWIRLLMHICITRPQWVKPHIKIKLFAEQIFFAENIIIPNIAITS